MSTKPPPFRIKRTDPAKPHGAFVVQYDREEDILWVGRACPCSGEACIHASCEVTRPTPHIAVSISKGPSGKQIVSSVALLKVSSHPAWAALFAALEWALSTARPVTLSTRLDWFTQEAFLGGCDWGEFFPPEDAS